MHRFESDGGGGGSSLGGSSESEFEPGCTSKRKKKQQRRKGAGQQAMGFHSPSSDYVRTTGRSKGIVSYKDFYGSDMGSSENGGEGGEEGAEPADAEGGVLVVEDNRETIEKILKKRLGKIGGGWQ